MTNKFKVLSNEQIGDLEWNSESLEMYYAEQFKENHPAEMEAILKAQLKYTLQQVVEMVEGIEEEVKFRWKNNQDYLEGIQVGVEAFREAAIQTIKQKLQEMEGKYDS